MTAAGWPPACDHDMEWLRARWSRVPAIIIGYDRKAGKFTACSGIGEQVMAAQDARVLDAQVAHRLAQQEVDAVRERYGHVDVRP